MRDNMRGVESGGKKEINMGLSYIFRWFIRWFDRECHDGTDELQAANFNTRLMTEAEKYFHSMEIERTRPVSGT